MCSDLIMQMITMLNFLLHIKHLHTLSIASFWLMILREDIICCFEPAKINWRHWIPHYYYKDARWIFTKICISKMFIENIFVISLTFLWFKVSKDFICLSLHLFARIFWVGRICKIFILCPLTKINWSCRSYTFINSTK